jgi:hypothetical protein
MSTYEYVYIKHLVPWSKLRNATYRLMSISVVIYRILLSFKMVCERPDNVQIICRNMQQ